MSFCFDNEIEIISMIRFRIIVEQRSQTLFRSNDLWSNHEKKIFLVATKFSCSSRTAPVNVESSSVSKVSTVKEVQILSNALYKKINFPVSVVYINLYRLLVILSIKLFVSVSLWWGLQRIDTTDILVVSQGIVSRTYIRNTITVKGKYLK